MHPIVVATSNDWRAIEAGAHAYAARSGRYTSLTTWEINAKGNLVGTIEMPMALGLVGGAMAAGGHERRLVRRILGTSSASAGCPRACHRVRASSGARCQHWDLGGRGA